MRTPPPFTMVMLAVLLTGTASLATEPAPVTRAKSIAKDYETALSRLTGGLDAVKALWRLQAAGVALAGLGDMNLQNKLLNRFHPVDSKGVRLTGDAEMNASERFLQQLSTVPATADRLDKCVAAIVGSAPEFVFLPLDHVLLAKRFLPAPAVDAFLHAADLVGRVDSLTPTEVDELYSALRTAMRVDAERQLSACVQVVSNYREIRLRGDADLDLLQKLDPNIAHSPIKDLRTVN
ncbi:hypothetical protein [Bradyrhizobium australafricanum]|uniref:hypothetical protein n=1 Tax=Bradyrhizobium australafricanum TaxID=2821406 RepID=UPI001CE2C93B|nr:hypothetical protein [Bradyrhizobium australafricanum]MCA6098184.1 hypothetical protein [Bradyrhizobium australafricanum]